jgi:hypothetical protein
MRYMEIKGHFQIPLSNEESDIVDAVVSSDRGMLERASMETRNREIARKLVSRGVLNRVRNGDEVFYLINDIDNPGVKDE